MVRAIAYAPKHLPTLAPRPHNGRMPTMVLRVLAALLVTLVGIVAVPAPVACACSCAEVDTETALADATAVFDGSVVSASAPTGNTSADPIYYTIDVSRVYKGDVPATVIVSSAASGASCGVELTGQVTVFAGRSDGVLHTTLCSAPVVLDRSKLGPGHAPAPAPDQSSAPTLPVEVTPVNLPLVVGVVAGVLVIAVAVIWLVRRTGG